MYAHYVETLQAMEEIRASYLEKLKAKVQNGHPPVRMDSKTSHIRGYLTPPQKDLDCQRIVTYRHSVPIIRYCESLIKVNLIKFEQTKQVTNYAYTY